MKHLGDARHLGMMEVVTCSLEHALCCITADVVFEHEPPRELGTLLGRISAVDNYEQRVCIGRVTRDVNVL